MNPYDDSEFYEEQLQSEREYADSETARADEAERLLTEMAHAFREAAIDAYAAFRAKEPTLREVVG